MNNEEYKFISATPANIKMLAPGCFAQIGDTNYRALWVEIIAESKGRFTGVVHKELSSVECNRFYKDNQRVSFTAERIQHLGCDRYCFCDRFE